MKNKFVSLFDVVKLISEEVISEKYVRYLCGIDKEREYRHQEILDINCMLEYNNLGHVEADGFVYGYVVPQLNKEFDLIKVTENLCINIELKSEAVEVDKIKNQLIRNEHFIKMFNRQKNYFFTFIFSEKILYQLIDESLVKIPSIKLIEILSNQKACFFDFDEIFIHRNILVSPLNDTDKFLSGQYLLTEHQRNIEDKVFENNKICNNYRFIGLTGGPGYRENFINL